MYKHILNLKKKVSPVIIEKIIIRNESAISKILRTAFSIVVVFAIVWGVTKAEEIISEMLPQEEIEPTVSFSLAGLIKEIYPDKIVLTRAVGVDSEINVFDIDIATNEQIIETNTYEKILATDLLAGDKVIIQGLKRDGKFYSRRIISFAPRFVDTEGVNGVIEPEIASEEILEAPVATTTEPLAEDLATTTDELILDTASTTEETETTDNSTSTESEITNNTATSSEETATTTENTSGVSNSTDESPASSEKAGAPESTESTATEPAADNGEVTENAETTPETQPALESDNSSAESTVDNQSNSADSANSDSAPESSGGESSGAPTE